MSRTGLMWLPHNQSQKPAITLFLCICEWGGSIVDPKVDMASSCPTQLQTRSDTIVTVSLPCWNCLGLPENAGWIKRAVILRFAFGTRTFAIVCVLYAPWHSPTWPDPCKFTFAPFSACSLTFITTPWFQPFCGTLIVGFRFLNAICKCPPLPSKLSALSTKTRHCRWQHTPQRHKQWKGMTRKGTRASWLQANCKKSCKHGDDDNGWMMTTTMSQWWAEIKKQPTYHSLKYF